MGSERWDCSLSAESATVNSLESLCLLNMTLDNALQRPTNRFCVRKRSTLSSEPTFIKTPKSLWEFPEN